VLDYSKGNFVLILVPWSISLQIRFAKWTAEAVQISTILRTNLELLPTSENGVLRRSEAGHPRGICAEFSSRKYTLHNWHVGRFLMRGNTFFELLGKHKSAGLGQ